MLDRPRCYEDIYSPRSTQELGLEIIGHEEMAIQPFGSKASEVIRMTKYLVKFKGSFPGAKTIQVEALTQKTICGESTYQGPRFAIELKEKGFVLADDRVSSHPKAKIIGLLIGADYYWDIVDGGVITGGLRTRYHLRCPANQRRWLRQSFKYRKGTTSKSARNPSPRKSNNFQIASCLLIYSSHLCSHVLINLSNFSHISYRWKTQLKWTDSR